MTLVIGHKGAPTAADENRVSSFTEAKRAGADGVELDVRRASGGRLAVWHDPALADGRVLVETPWEQLDGDVDELPAVLDAAAGLDLVNVEIKNWPADADYDASLGIADEVADLLADRTPVERAGYLVSCFDPPTLARARRRLDSVAPEIATGLLVWLVDDATAVVAQAVEASHQALHPHHSAVTSDLVEVAHEAGLTVNCWTCNDPDRIRWLAGIGTDGIITDVPEQARAALAAG